MLAALVDTALAQLATTPKEQALARALVDLDTWQTLRNQGLEGTQAVAEVSDILAVRLGTGQRRPRGAESHR
jgi:hypothetical protein